MKRRRFTQSQTVSVLRRGGFWAEAAVDGPNNSAKVKANFLANSW